VQTPYVDEPGLVITQVVSCRLPTAVASVRPQVRSCGICGGQSGIAAGFLGVLRFPLSVVIPPNAPYPGAGAVGSLVA
jgi:hypothetical protein